jgi:hypothetical protein
VPNSLKSECAFNFFRLQEWRQVERVASLLQPVQTVRTTTDATLQSVVFFKEKAKGIIRHFMICTKGRNTCSGCSQELARHRKTIQLEKELQAIAVDNDKLAPLLQYSS